MLEGECRGSGSNNNSIISSRASMNAFFGRMVEGNRRAFIAGTIPPDIVM